LKPASRFKIAPTDGARPRPPTPTHQPPGDVSEDADELSMNGLPVALRIETTIEPQLTEEAARRYPHTQAWMNKYLGILIFKLRPLASH
jgi:hypothetical protein